MSLVRTYTTQPESPSDSPCCVLATSWSLQTLSSPDAVATPSRSPEGQTQVGSPCVVLRCGTTASQASDGLGTHLDALASQTAFYGLSEHALPKPPRRYNPYPATMIWRLEKGPS